MIAIRGLPAADIGPPDLITRDELGDELEQLFEEEYPPEEQERDNIALRALGLLGQDEDVAELQLQLLGDQVLGFYDDVEQRMVVVTDAGLDPEAQLTYAHEYTHALQDAAFDFDSLETDADGEDDRGLARTALIEGDATDHDARLGVRAPDPGGAARRTSRRSRAAGHHRHPVVDGRASSQFPYDEGPVGERLAGGTRSAPTTPSSTQPSPTRPTRPSRSSISMTGRHASRRSRSRMPDLAAALGEGWDEVDATPIGQAIHRDHARAPRRSPGDAARRRRGLGRGPGGRRDRARTTRSRSPGAWPGTRQPTRPSSPRPTRSSWTVSASRPRVVELPNGEIAGRPRLDRGARSTRRVDAADD